MEFRLLGPVEVQVAGRLMPIGRRQERCALAILLLQAGQPVSADRIAELIWADEPPRSPRDVVQTYLSRLRAAFKAAGADLRLERRQHAYVLDVDPETVDVHRFERLVAQARATADPGARGDLLRSALALWRGPALADLGPGPVRERLGVRLDEARLHALDQRIVADLADGRHGELLGELTELAARSPLDERLGGHLMLALYRSGRRTDALERFHLVRTRMRDELGLDPGEELQRLNTSMIRGDPPRPAPAPSPPVAQLAAAIPDFTGRADLIGRLDALLPPGDAAALTVATIAGTGGVGKTALALWWAHRVAPRFPDGQLFVDLRGFGPGSPMRPIEALAGFLRALGVPADTIPVETDEAAALYRSRLAGRRILVLLDNAASADQVRPLLPGDRTCLVLITSRDQLPGLVATHGAHRLMLDLFSEDDALALLRHILGAARVAAEPEAGGRLAHRCGYLPLALRIAAAHLVQEPGLSIGDYVGTLVEAGPLNALAIEDDPQIAVRAAFATSYARLSPAEQLVFRRLGLVPGTDVGVEAVAALAGLPAAEAGRLLGRLTATHLVEQRSPGRYTLHDLIRLYAAEQATLSDVDADRAAAVARLLDWYLHTADAAARLLYPDVLRLDLPAAAGPGAAGFAGHAEALAWLSAERPNLIAAIRHAAAHGPYPLAWLLTDTLRGYFWQSRHTVDWLDAAHASLAAADREPDPQPSAALRLSLGAANYCLDRGAQAIDHYTEAAKLSERAGWTAGQAASAGNLGMVFQHLGRLGTAAEYHEQALALKRGNGRAVPLANLGGVYHDLGQLRRAAECYLEALDLHRQVGSRAGEAIALNNLGEVEYELGRFTEAEPHLVEALALQREVGKRYGEAETLCHLAGVRHSLGRHAEALADAESALHLALAIGERRIEAAARVIVGTIQLKLADRDAAQAQFRQARAAAQETGADYPLVLAQLGLAAVAQTQNQKDQAIGYATEALDLATRCGYHALAGRAHARIASIHHVNGDVILASEHEAAAARIRRDTGDRLDPP